MITFTWFGTATVLLNVDGEKLLFDPFFRTNKKLEQTPLCTFTEVDCIFNTHPHFDHLCNMPQILPKTKAMFYGTPTAYLRLQAEGVELDKNIQILCPHQKIETKHAKIQVHRARHVKNNLGIILKTAFKIIFTAQLHKVYKILSLHHKYLMGGDIVAYQINAKGKCILLFGSAGIDKTASLPKDVDVLIWPYQGRTGMAKYSLKILQKINPKQVILTHFDNAFPPITGNVKTKSFEKLIKQKMPYVKVIVPLYAQQIEIK